MLVVELVGVDEVVDAAGRVVDVIEEGEGGGDVRAVDLGVKLGKSGNARRGMR